MFDFSFVTEHMGPSVRRGGCPWERCAGRRTHSVSKWTGLSALVSCSRADTHVCPCDVRTNILAARDTNVSNLAFAKGRSSLGCSSKIRTCSITNMSWWMNWGGRHVCVKMPSYYRSNWTNQWSRLKVTLISFWRSIIGSAPLVMAGSTISIPMLLFGEHDRAALLWLTWWRITLLFFSSS